MTRKLLIEIIAVLYFAKGLWDIRDFLSAFFLSSVPLTIKLFSLVGGILEIYIGINLLQFKEAGRKTLLVLSTISAAAAVILVSGMLFFWQAGFGFNIYFFNSAIFKSENRLVFLEAVSIFVIFPLLIVIFLSRGKTKTLFSSEVQKPPISNAMARRGSTKSRPTPLTSVPGRRITPNTQNSEQDFGCAECWPQEAELAFDAFRALENDSFIVDESHYIIIIKRCLKCSQKFLSIFTETVDYIDGDDPQYRIVMPITADESGKLLRWGEYASNRDLESIGIGRRSLHWDHPKGSPVSIYWGTGVQIGPHH